MQNMRLGSMQKTRSYLNLLSILMLFIFSVLGEQFLHHLSKTR
jgi:hypothetical protein